MPVRAGRAGPGGVEEDTYEFSMRFGPRPYQDYINATKALDAGPIVLEGRIIRDGRTAAWCSAHVDQIETPNNITDPQKYFPELRRMEYTAIPVRCVGPRADDAAAAGPLRVEWVAKVTLVGDREEETREFRSDSTVG